MELYLDGYSVQQAKEYLWNELMFDDCFFRYDLENAYVFDCYKDDERTIVTVYID